MLTLLEILWWIVLFPLLCTFVVNAYWRLKLQPTKGAPPYIPIVGFIFGGWYGYVLAFCLLMGRGFPLLFQLPRTPQAIQGRVGAEFLCSLVALATAFGGKFLLARITSPHVKDNS